MGSAIPAQNPEVVLRSQFQLVRALLVAATIAIVGLVIALVVVANDTDQASKSDAATSVQPLRYGGFNPGTGQPESAPLARQHPAPVVPAHPPISQYSGGVDESKSSAVKDYSLNSATGDVGGEPAQTSDTAQKSENGPGARTR